MAVKEPRRLQLLRAVGRDVSRFQEATYAFDDVAAEILALQRTDLPCMTLLLFNGPAPADAIAAALHAPPRAVNATLERLQLAGYARFTAGGGTRIEITEHARTWIERIWAPLREEGERLLGTYPTRELTLLNTFMQRACEIQEGRTHKLRTWLALPSSPAPRSHLRGGLSPAALRRVQVFVEANLARPIHLRDLAVRAALSSFHFARAFKTSAGVTPRAFVEDRRIERAKQLLRETTQPLVAVAVESGFVTQSRLTTTFRRRTGFTPAAYRRAKA